MTVEKGFPSHWQTHEMIFLEKCHATNRVAALEKKATLNVGKEGLGHSSLDRVLAWCK